MQFSNIFASIKQHNFFIFILALLITLSIISEFTSFSKLKSLHNQKQIATDVYNLGRADLDLTNIQFRGKNTLLRHEGNALLTLYSYDYLNNLSKSNNYQNDIAKLQHAIKSFNSAATAWYSQEEMSEEELQNREASFKKTYQALMFEIDSIIEDNYKYEDLRFKIQLGLASLMLLLLLLSLVWVPRKLNGVVKEMEAFAAAEIEEGRSSPRNLKAETAQNPAYLDAVSGIQNHKGFMYEANNRKSQSIGNYSAVCIFAIDNLSTIESKMPKEFTEELIKKVAFMLSLYRQHNDVIGRLDHNQFAFYISRQDKASALNDCESVRKSIEDTPFKNSEGRAVKVNISGGFVQKMSTQSLDEVLAKATKILAMSIQHGGNRIAQLRDKNTALK